MNLYLSPRIKKGNVIHPAFLAFDETKSGHIMKLSDGWALVAVPKGQAPHPWEIPINKDNMPAICQKLGMPELSERRTDSKRLARELIDINNPKLKGKMVYLYGEPINADGS